MVRIQVNKLQPNRRFVLDAIRPALRASGRASSRTLDVTGQRGPM